MALAGIPIKASCGLFLTIIQQYRDYQKGIPPTREWMGRGAQNPRLLDCFDMLERAEKSMQK